MLTYHLKPHDQQPLYEQLYHAVRADIMSGALPGGTRLPKHIMMIFNGDGVTCIILFAVLENTSLTYFSLLRSE